MDLSPQDFIADSAQRHEPATALPAAIAPTDPKYAAISAALERVRHHGTGFEMSDLLTQLDQRPAGKGMPADHSPRAAQASAGRAGARVQLAQADPASTARTISLTSCAYMARGGEGTIENSMRPRTDLWFYLAETTRSRPPAYLPGASAVRVVTPPRFGQLVSRVDDDGEPYFDYIAHDKNWLGQDQAEFSLQYQGQPYRIVSRLVMVVDPADHLDDKAYQACPSRPQRMADEVARQGARAAVGRGA